MKTMLYKSLLLTLFVLLPLNGSAHTGPQLNGRHTKEKTIKREFKVSPDALLKISNSYGNLTLTSWNEDRVVIEVHIKTNGNNEEKVQEKLDEIQIEFENSTSMVSARTQFNSNRGGWNWGWGGKNNVNMQVNYNVKLPVKNNISLDNDYGNIIIDRIDGHAKISCDYGRLDIGELRGRNNQLSFDYTTKSNFGYINSASISADYSGFTIDKAGNLDVTADYTNAYIKAMDDLEYTSDYGSLEIGEVKNVRGKGDYINVNLGTVRGNVSIAADYGSLEIKKLDREAGNINLETDYTGIKIGYSESYSFDFEISTDYADLRGTDDLEIAISNVKTRERYYKGHYGQANSGNKLTIRSDYGGITLEKVN